MKTFIGFIKKICWMNGDCGEEPTSVAWDSGQPWDNNTYWS